MLLLAKNGVEASDVGRLYAALARLFEQELETRSIEPSQPRSRVSLLKRRNLGRVVARKPTPFEKLREGLLSHPLSFKRVREHFARRRKVRVHLNRLLKLRRGLIVLSRLVEREADERVDYQRE